MGYTVSMKNGKTQEKAKRAKRFARKDKERYNEYHRSYTNPA